MLPKKLQETTHSHKNVMFVSVLAIGIFAVYNWAIAPHRSFILAAQKYESTIEDIARKTQILSNNITAKKKTILRLNEGMSQTRSRLFNQVEAREFFGSLETAAQKKGCQLKSLILSSPGSLVKSKAPQDQNYLTTQHATLTLRGDFSGLTAFIKELQDHPQDIRITTLQIDPDNQLPGFLVCDITVTIYVIEEEKGINDDAA